MYNFLLHQRTLGSTRELRRIQKKKRRIRNHLRNTKGILRAKKQVGHLINISQPMGWKITKLPKVRRGKVKREEDH